MRFRLSVLALVLLATSCGGASDEAASGLRLRIFVADEGGTWTLHTVESTVMCQSHRGGTPGQPCP